MTPLYRYISLDSSEKWKRFLKLLNDNSLYFSSPKDFNDPYDAKVNFADGSVEEIEQYFLKVHKLQDPSATDEELLPKIRERRRIDPKYNSDWIRTKAKDILDPELDAVGVVCLSEKKDSILMWSHYADAHKGICLEFNKDVIHSNRWFYDKVQYPANNHYPEFKQATDALEDTEKSVRLFLLKKSNHWAYENEWRIILDKIDVENNGNDEETKRYFNCPENMLTGIIFGMKTPTVLKQTIAQLAQSKSIQLYQAERNENSYSIDISAFE